MQIINFKTADVEEERKGEEENCKNLGRQRGESASRAFLTQNLYGFNRLQKNFKAKASTEIFITKTTEDNYKLQL